MGVNDGTSGDQPVDGKERLTNGNALDSAVSDVHRQAKIAHQTDHNHTVNQADDEGSALLSGRRRLSHRAPDDREAAKKKRDKEQSLFRWALKQLKDRLEELFEELAAINERLEELALELEELDYLQELAERGRLDPKNPDHVRLFNKYGIAEDDLDSGRILILLNEQRGYRIDERTALEKRRDDLQDQANEAIYDAQADGTITPEETERFRNRLQVLEDGVSAQVRVTTHASQELKDESIAHFTHTMDEDVSIDGLQLSTDTSTALSFADSLDKQQNEDTAKHSLKEKFTAMADSPPGSLRSDHVAIPKALPEFIKS